jgi:acetyltransferase
MSPADTRQSTAAVPARFRPERLFHPARIAVIGAGEGATSAGAGAMLARLNAGRFTGIIEASAGAANLTATPDLAILCLPPDAIAAACAILAARGTAAAIVPGPGPDDGLASIARATGLRLLGPYSFGLAVTSIRLDATTSHIPPPPGRLALLAQSSAIARAVVDWAGPNGVGFSHVVGIGSNHDIGFNVALDWLSQQPETGTILIELRRLRDRRAFLSAARAAARLRPVVALRAGALAADAGGDAEAAFVAALARVGVLTVTSFEALLAAAETLSHAPPARGPLLAVLSDGVGPAQLAADAALRQGLAIMQPDASLLARLAPLGASAPTAIGGALLVPEASLAAATDIVAAAPDAGGVVLVTAPAPPRAPASVAWAPVPGAAPVLVALMGESQAASHRAALTAQGFAVFAGPIAAAQGFSHLLQHRRIRAAAAERVPAAVLTVAPDRATAARLLRAPGADLPPDLALELLAAYGIPTLPHRLARSPADAADAASLLGFPVSLRRRRLGAPTPDEHIALGLADRLSVATAASQLLAETEDPKDTLLIQRQAGRATPLSLRLYDDAIVGPALFLGPGGAFARDRHLAACAVPPLNLPLAHALLDHLPPLVLAARPDRPAPGRAALAGMLVRVSQLLVDHPTIAALSLDPVFADAEGVAVADAWVRTREPGAPPAFLAIPPYPSDLEENITLGRHALRLRPIRPEDGEAHAAFFARLPAEDVRYRFFNAIRELPPDLAARLTRIDYAREMAFVALRGPEIVGIARLICDRDAEAEFAIVVQPDMKGTGLARALMHRLIAWAPRQGITTILGQVLADNAPMQGFVRRLGFTLRRLPAEPDLLEARLDLAPQEAVPIQLPARQ